MKKLRVPLEVGALIMLLAAFSSNAWSEQQWLDVTVERAGYSAGSVIGIKLSHSSQNPLFVNKWYKARSDVAEGMLSLAVWALETDSVLSVQLDPFSPEWSEIDKMYLK
jgi:hypothetical protein